MRLLNRNKKLVYYSNYVGKTAKFDSNGDRTGEYEVSYTTPKSLHMSFTQGIGNSIIDKFGNVLYYDATVITNDMNCPIDENSRLWIGKLIDSPHNYEVLSKSESINYITYVLKEVSK